MRFKDKIIIVTGSSSGIGAKTAIAFAKEGANLVLTYNTNKSGGEEVLNTIKNLGRKAILVQASLENENHAKRVIEETLNEFDKIDILINNAGRFFSGDEWNGKSELLLKSIEQNLISAMNMSKFAAVEFKKQQFGIIVNIASRFGIEGDFEGISYSAAKAGIINLTKSYAKLLIPYGRVNTISPGAVETGYWLTAPSEEVKETLSQVPLNKLIEPDDIAQAVLFLSSDSAKMITGHNLVIYGGFNL